MLGSEILKGIAKGSQGNLIQKSKLLYGQEVSRMWIYTIVKRTTMTNQEWIDLLSVEFSVSRSKARDMLHRLMQMATAYHILHKEEL